MNGHFLNSWHVGMDSPRETAKSSARGELRACCRRLSIHARIRDRSGVSAMPHEELELENGFGSNNSQVDGSARELDSADSAREAIFRAEAAKTAFHVRNLLSGKEQLNRKDVFEVMESLYRDHPGPVWRVESRKAMECQQDTKTVKCLIYGEVSFIAFARMLDLCVPLVMKNSLREGFSFYDLGCGAGRPVFMAALLRNDCVKACGIEIIPRMHHMNQELLMLYRTEVLPFLHPSRQDQVVSFIQGDFLQEDWSDADVVFANATCFDDPLFEQLEKRATSTMREGSIVITVTRSFVGDTWELLQQQEMKMSWASAKVHVQRKKKHIMVSLPEM